MFMTEKTLETKLKNVAKRYPDRKLPLKFLKRRKMFVNYKESCAFNPLTGDGHSYRWYWLTAVINGRLVLNTFGYSIQTRKHVNKVSRLLSMLRIPYLTIEAPMGLQDMIRAKQYTILEYSRALVEYKYARKKSWYSTFYKRQNVQNLAKIGYKMSKVEIDMAIQIAENERLEKNKRLREQRARAKELAKPALSLVS